MNSRVTESTPWLSVTVALTVGGHATSDLIAQRHVLDHGRRRVHSHIEAVQPGGSVGEDRSLVLPPESAADR